MEFLTTPLITFLTINYAQESSFFGKFAFAEGPKIGFPRIFKIFLSLEFLRTNFEQKFLQVLIPYSPFWVLSCNALPIRLQEFLNFNFNKLWTFFRTLLDIFVGSKTRFVFWLKSGKVHPDRPQFGPSQSDSKIFETWITQTGPFMCLSNHVFRSQ